MRKLLTATLVIGAMVLGVVMAAQPRMTWQDVLAKPSHAWLAKFQYSDGSHLAYHIVRLMENDRNLNVKIRELEKRIAGLEDPNTVTLWEGAEYILCDECKPARAVRTETLKRCQGHSKPVDPNGPEPKES
jgi:hypothetical protein